MYKPKNINDDDEDNEIGVIRRRSVSEISEEKHLLSYGGYLSQSGELDVQRESLINQNQQGQINELYSLNKEVIIKFRTELNEWTKLINKNVDDLINTIKKADIDRIDAILKRFEVEIKEITIEINSMKIQYASLNPNIKIDWIEKTLNEIRTKIVEMDKTTSKNLSDFKNFRNLSEQFDKNYTDDIKSLKESVNNLNTFKEKALMAFLSLIHI